MKKDNSLQQKRDSDLYDVYVKGLNSIHFSSMIEAVNWARTQPAPSFYLSPKALVNYIRTLRNGSTPSNMFSWNKKKIDVLYRMYLEFMEMHPDNTLSTEMICEELVDSPAPRFFIGEDCAMKAIRKERYKHRRIAR